MRSFFCLAVVLLASTASAGPLELRLDDRARVAGMSVDGKSLPGRPAPLLTLYEAETKLWHEPQAVAADAPGRWTLAFPEAKAKVDLSVADRGGALRFLCRLKGDDGPARGLLLRFAFGLEATGWHWHSDMQTAQTIEPGRVYENVAPLKAWADLPEWKGQAALRIGYSNRNFCTVLSGPATGLCLAVPLDRPCIFRTAYNGRAPAPALELVYDFALSPDTRVPNQVEFAFDLYACDPQWGFRAALAKYYELYPELFRNHVKEPGQWMAFSALSKIDNANEFSFGLQEGASEPAYDDKLGVLSTTYFTHAGMGANIPGFDPEKDPLPDFDTQLKAVEEAFKRRTGEDGLYARVGLHDASGRLDIRRWKVYAHLIAQFNLDPELPYGAWTLQRAEAMLDEVQRRTGGRLDGFYYDGLSTGVNYRAEHFRTAQAPCLWDPVAKRALLNNFFSSCEFARAAAELLRPMGRITMMNGAMGASFYVAPWLDVLGAETGLRISREQFNSIRTITYRKPFLTLLKGNYEQNLGHKEIELYMQRCLAYGVFPGFFDWPPSGLGPGGRYWDHARYYERDRKLFRKYLPLCQALARAGWEPVTHARCSEPRVCVERFGARPLAWFSMMNETSEPCRVRLTIDEAALPESRQLEAAEWIHESPVALSQASGGVTAELDIPADGVAVLQIGPPEEAASWRLRQALGMLDRSVQMIKLDAGKPPLPVHWRVERGDCGRSSEAGKHRLVLAAGATLGQWAMLFQPQPGEVTLRVRARADAAARRRRGIDCRLAWVTPSYSHYQNEFFRLPDQAFDWRDFEFKINSPEALRAVQLRATVDSGAQGTLEIAKISLADAAGEHAIDPEFHEWYEPMTPEVREWVLAAVSQIQESLTNCEYGEAGARIRTLRRRIDAAGRQNACRRVLRDLDAVERLLIPRAR